MDGVSWLRSLDLGGGTPREVDWLDVLVYAEERHPEPGGAARYLAGELGVSRRSAERYLAVTTPGVKESQMPTGRAREAAEALKAQVQREFDEADAAARRQEVADLLRLITSIKPGKVKVQSRSGRMDDSARSIGGELDVDLDAVAGAWENGDEDLAAAELSDALMDAYGARGGVDSLGDSLRVLDYPPGLDWS